jgi:uncharacterized protein (TIGR03000 family)
MFRKCIRFTLAVAVLAIAAQQAQAGWHHHRAYYGSYGSWGSYGSSGGWGYGSWGSSGGSWGSSGGWGSYGSWGSSGGSWGSSGGYAYSPSCGSSGGYGGYGGYKVIGPANPATPSAPGPAPSPTPEAAPAPGPAPGSSTYHPTYGPLRDSAILSVKVPADAQVFVNEHATTSTGSDREFISRNLQNGASYNYVVRASFVRDGQPVTETKLVQLTAGQSSNLDFTAGEQTAQTKDMSDSLTSLTVRLPADAKLYLGGHETQARGDVREFSTTKLPAGSEWASYAIRAVIERDGKQEVREENISLKAGESRELTINFDAKAGDPIAETASR